MVLLWIIVWALAGQPSVGGWWIVTLILAALTTFNISAKASK